MIDFSTFGSTPAQEEPVVDPTPEPPQRAIAAMSQRGTTGYSREVPWGAAKYAQWSKEMDKAGSAREAMRNVGLDWEVSLVPVYTERPSGMIAVEGRYAVERSDTNDALGIVGERYELIQNRRLAEFTDTFITVSDGKGTSMGEVKGGRKVFTVVQLEDINPPGMGEAEALGSFIISSNSHDGSSTLFSTIVNIRWACTNGLIALNKAAHTVKVRHSGNVENRMQEAQLVLSKASEYLEAQEALMVELLSKPIGLATRGEELVERLIPTRHLDADSPALKSQERRQDDLITLWRNSDNLDNIRGTAWGFVNAVAEWDQWDTRANRRRTVTPMERLLTTDPTKSVVHRALALV